MTQDLRYALRALRASPGFASVAILSLALGIGANTAIFSLIDSLILKPLPVSHPEKLLQVTRGKEDYYTNPIWEQVRDRQDVFSGIFAYGGARFNLASAAKPAMPTVTMSWPVLRNPRPARRPRPHPHPL